MQQIKINLNTSNVDIKHMHLLFMQQIKIYLNTSNVDIKP